MPALKIFRHFSTKPFAGDDLHIVIFVLGVYRVIQTMSVPPFLLWLLFYLVLGRSASFPSADSHHKTFHPRCFQHNRCVVPLFIRTLLLQYNGEDLLVNGFPNWCSQAEDYWNKPRMILTVTDYEDRQIERNTFLEGFVLVSCAFLALDISWLVMVWVATSVGTPTQPKGRDEYLRWDLSHFRRMFEELWRGYLLRYSHFIFTSGNLSYSRCSSSTAFLLYSSLLGASKSKMVEKITMGVKTNLL